MRSKLLFLIVLIVAFAALPGSVLANLVPNPSFENGTWVATDYPEDWTGWNPGGSCGIDEGTRICMVVVAADPGLRRGVVLHQQGRVETVCQ